MADTAVYSADGKWSISGTTATYKVGSDVVAKITGLASGLKADDLNTASNNYINVEAPSGSGTVGTITLKKDALGTSASKIALTLSNSGSYKLALDSITVTNQGSITPTALNKSSGKATVVGTIGAGYTLVDDNTIVYNASQKTGVTLATVSGLVSSIPDGSVSESSGVITLTEDAFNKKKVTLSSGYGYTLSLNNGTNAVTTLGGDTENAAWTVSGTTATYKQTRTAQYTLADDGKSVTYTAAKTATLATVKGLAKGLTATSGAISGISVTASTFESDALKTAGSIELSANVLGTSKVTLTAGKTLDGIADDYNLTLASAVPGQSGSAPSNENVWTVSGTTAIYKTVTPTHYLLDSTTKKSVTYEKQKDVEKLATVKGLAKGLTADGTNTTAVLKDGDTAVVSVSGTGVEVNPYTIQLKKGALTTTNVTITPGTDKYAKLAVYTTDDDQKVTAPEITPTWSVSGTTATLKGTIVAGYELSTDGSKITYTKNYTNPTTLATVKNLATGLTNGTDGNAGKVGTDVSGTFTEAISVSVDSGKVKKTDGVATITLKAAALGTKNITLSGTGYKLALDSTQLQTASNTTGEIINNESPVVTSGKDVWRLDGTTATYKNVVPAYYTPSDTTITYTKEDADKTTEALKTAAVIATVTGLKSGLTAGDDSINDSTGAEVVKIVDTSVAGTTVAPIEIQLEAGALTTGDVTLTTGAKADSKVYALKLGTVDEPTLDGDLTWATEDVAASGSTPASTTVIIRSGAQEGWTLNDDKDTITYAPASTATDVATITGLKAGLAANETYGIFANATDAEAATAAGTLITLNSKAITLTADVLGEQDIAVTGDYGYTFATVTGLVQASTANAPTATDMWVMGSGSTAGTAEYKSMVPKYFKYKRPEGANADDTTKLVYVAQEASTAAGALKATLTGLKTDLVASSDGQSIKDADETADVVTLASKAVTIEPGALDSKTVTIMGTGYTLEEGTDIANSEATYDLTYNATAGTATLKKGTSEGYTLNSASTALEYTAYIASDGASATTVASITGLKTGLEEELVVNGMDGTSAYITHDETSTKTITLAPAVLGTLSAGITLNNDSEYILVLSDGNIPASDDTGWTVTSVAAPTGGVSTTTATLYSHTTAAYTVASGSKAINYTAAANTAKKLAEITGLAYGLSASTVDQQIDGITVSSNDIKLTADVLTSSDLTLKNESGQNYVFSLQQDTATADDFVPDPADTTNTWSITSGTLTYKVTTPNSYTVDTAQTAITFTPEMVDTTTITGLKSSLNRIGGEVTVTPGGTAVTIVDGLTLTPPVKGTAAVTDGSGSITTPAVDPTPGTFNIGSAVLGKKDINIVNDDGNADSVTGDFDYNIALASDVTNKADLNAPVWNKTNKTTTATYTQTFNKGYTQTDDENIIYASKKTKKTLATLTGLNKDVVANADGSINGISIASASVTVSATTGGTSSSVVGGEVITLSDKSLFTTTNVALGKTDNYYLAVDESLASDDADLHWTYSNGTAQLVTGTTEGWQIKETTKNGTTTYKTIVYTKADETSTGYVKAKITGLNKSLEINDDGTIDGLEFNEAPSGGTGTIYVGADAVEGITGKVELTGAGTSYVLAYGDDITLPAAEDPEWVVSKGTATYQYDISEGWNLKDTSLTYQAAKTTTLTTITGLNSSLEAAGEDIKVTEDYYELSEDGTEYVQASGVTKGTITLSKTALEGAKTVKFKESSTNQRYAFAFGDDVYAEGVSGTNQTEDLNADEWKGQDGWVTNGTTATYLQNYDKDHYKFNADGSIAAATITNKGTALATLKGIKKDAVITDQNGLITLDSTQLDGKAVTLTNSPGYALALQTDTSEDNAVTELSTYINKKWATSGNKANLTGTLTKGYQVSADGKTVTYNNTAKSTTLATVAGIKSNVNIKDCVDESTGEITLSKAQLDGKTVTLTNTANLGYYFKLGDDVAAPVIDDSSIEWAVKGDTATLTGKIKTAGFTVAPDAQSIAYTAQTTGTKVATLATIKGINQDIADTLPDLLKTETGTTVATDTLGTITLRNELLSDSVTVDGKNLFAFSFEADFSNKTINGSTASDKLTIAGTGVSVNAGKGNDVIDFGTGGGNTLVYASGDGDDEVENFSDSDVINSNKVDVTGDNIKTDAATNNVLVTIGKNTITLDGYTGGTLTVTDKTGTPTTYEPQEINPFWTESTTASDVLLADNNYSADAAALSDIVEPFKASYTPYDFDGGLDPFKQDSFAPAVTYNGTDKK